jgi:hypothetical protein
MLTQGKWKELVKSYYLVKASTWTLITRRSITVRVTEEFSINEKTFYISLETRILTPGKDFTRNSLKLTQDNNDLTIQTLCLQTAMQWKNSLDLPSCPVFVIKDGKKSGYLMKG